MRSNIEDFTCPFCFDKDDSQKQLQLIKKNENDNFWKKIQGHLGGYQHLKAFSKFKKSIKKGK